MSIDDLKMILVSKFSLVIFIIDEDVRLSPDMINTELLHSNTASHIPIL